MVSFKKHKEYYQFLKEVFIELHRVLRDDGVIVFVIGDVEQNHKPPINLAKKVWEESVKPLNLYNLFGIVDDNIEDWKKTTKIWGKTKGEATKIDRCLVVYKKENDKGIKVRQNKIFT